MGNSKQSCLRMKISSVSIKCGPIFYRESEWIISTSPQPYTIMISSIYRPRTIMVSRALSDTTSSEKKHNNSAEVKKNNIVRYNIERKKTSKTVGKKTGVTLHRS
jgi:hypothetical protein